MFQKSCKSDRCMFYAKALQTCSHKNCMSKNNFFRCSPENTDPASSWCSHSNQFIVPRPLGWAKASATVQPRYRCDSEAWDATCDMIPALSVYEVSRAGAESAKPSVGLAVTQYEDDDGKFPGAVGAVSVVITDEMLKVGRGGWRLALRG